MTRFGGRAGLLLDDVGKNIDGICRDDDHAVEAFGHELADACTHDDGVASEHIETRGLKLARRANGDDDDGARSRVFVCARGDGDGSAEWHGLLEIQASP